VEEDCDSKREEHWKRGEKEELKEEREGREVEKEARWEKERKNKRYETEEGGDLEGVKE
jgi:hypothetical protein